MAVGKDLSCNCFSKIRYRKTKMQPQRKADCVARHAIESCQVSIVCKEKLVSLGEGAPVRNEAAADNPELQLKGSQEDNIETLKLELREALEVSENAKKELRSEIARRQKAEANSLKTENKLKDVEDALKQTAKEKEDLTSLLRVSEEKCHKIRSGRNEVEEELQAMVEKLTSLATNANKFSRERQEAIRELEVTRLKLAAMEEENHRILQKTNAEIKRLQDCLHSTPRIETPNSSSLSRNFEFREYSLDDIKAITWNFSDHFKLGEGGYGTVYKGEIIQTVKILSVDSLTGRREFEREIDILKDIRHSHLVSIVGACFELHCILYEYMSTGICLADRLSCKYATPPLPWQSRIRIAAEVCSALKFLHSCKPYPIVHHDLKPENILLDENYGSKICDIGLARLVPQHLRTEFEPEITFSYVDPEYLTSGDYSTKSDVYSLGIVILQLLTGKPAPGLVKEVECALENAKLDQVLDSSAGEWPSVEATQLAYLALHCTEPVKKNRPDLQPTVMEMLDQLRNIAVAASNSSRPVERGQNSAQAPEEIHVPSIFLCPILKEVMQDPRVAADGYTYEKEAIRGWIDCGRDSSPMTNKKLGHKNLIPNFSLRSAIRHWQETGELM